jgi:hypothetical protein
MIRVVLRALGHMFLWTAVKGSLRGASSDPGERRRIYTYIALCVLGVILLRSF